MTHVIGESWCWNGQSWSLPTCPKVTFAREFRYDGGRQRYLDRSLNACDFQNGIITPPADGTKWTDYDGDEPVADYTISATGVVTEKRSFELGVGRVDPWTDGSLGVGESNTAYYHADMLGTTRMMSGPNGQPITTYNGVVYIGPAVYTAFGEIVYGPNDGAGNRYGYVGEHGYQAHSEFPYLHLGARYYDPAMGRFLQRDPIGIDGGLNVYAYSENGPTLGVDPTGAFMIYLDPIFWTKAAASAGKKWAEQAMGCASKWGSLTRPIGSVASGLAAAPDMARIHIAVDFRRKTVLNPNVDLGDGLDAWEKGRDKRVKPGPGPKPMG